MKKAWLLAILLASLVAAQVPAIPTTFLLPVNVTTSWQALPTGSIGTSCTKDVIDCVEKLVAACPVRLVLLSSRILLLTVTFQIDKPHDYMASPVYLPLAS